MANMGPLAYFFMRGDKKEAKPSIGTGTAEKQLAENKEIYAQLQELNLKNPTWDSAFYDALKREGGGR